MAAWCSPASVTIRSSRTSATSSTCSRSARARAAPAAARTSSPATACTRSLCRSRSRRSTRRRTRSASGRPPTGTGRAVAGRGGNGPWVQVSRLGNPLINEVVIPTGLKDLWNRSSPDKDAQFVKYYKTPILAAVINKLYSLGVPTDNRDDLVQVLLTGIPKVTFTGSTPADELRINLSVPVTPAASQSRLGVLGGDHQGWPNGRRLNDDVVDIAEQAVGGFLLGHKLPLGDGVDNGDTAPMSSVPLRRGPVQRSRRHARAAEVMTRTRLLVAGAVAATAATALLFGGLTANGHVPGTVPKPWRFGTVGGRLRGRQHAGARAAAAGRAARPADERARARPARARLPAARPRDGRPLVLREVRGRPRPRAAARPARPRRDRRPCLARALPPPVRQRTRARPARP